MQNKLNLLLQCKDCGHATVNRVREPGLSLIGDGNGSVMAAVGRNAPENLGDVVGAKHLVDGGEAGNPLIGVKVGGKDAATDAFPPKELACTTRGLYGDGP